jgi:precorrin-6B methylase 2
MNLSAMVLNWRRKFLCHVFGILELIALHSTVVYFFYMKWIGDIFSDECTMAHVSSNETVLHIGCGTLPTISLLIAKNTHAHIIAIDNNKKTVQRAQRYINQQHLADFITVNYADGTRYPAESFDVIFIAINVTPIETLFQYLATTTKPSVRIICRDLGNGVINLLKNNEFADIYQIQSIQKHAKTHSLLITKHTTPFY